MPCLSAVCFTRNDGANDCEQRRFEFYRDYILTPFIDGSRKAFDDWQEGTDVPEDLAAASCWCDGDLAQIASVVDDDQQVSDSKNRIISCKHSAARSAMEQAANHKER